MLKSIYQIIEALLYFVRSSFEEVPRRRLPWYTMGPEFEFNTSAIVNHERRRWKNFKSLLPKSRHKHFFVKNLIPILIDLAASDGELSEREVKVIEEFLIDKLAFDGSRARKLLDELLAQRESNISYILLAETIKRKFYREPQRLIQVLLEGARVAKADGKVSLNARKILLKVAEIFDIEEQKVESML